MEIRKNNLNGINGVFFGGEKTPNTRDTHYEERDIANSPNPNEYLGRSQVTQTRTAFVSPISSKALAILLKNNIITTGFAPETAIASELEKYSSMPVAFQRKLAIDLLNEPQQRKNIYDEDGQLKSRITFGEFGKPVQIDYYDGEKTIQTVKLDYAQKQDGSYVLIKETMSDGTEINYHKHKNGAVTISSTDGRQMSYSLRHESIKDYVNTTTKPVVQIPTVEGGKSEPQKEKPFLLQKPNFQQREYSYQQKQIIERKFQAFQKNIDKRYDPNDKYAYCGHKSVTESLNQMKELILETNDPVLQDKIVELLNKMKNDYVPTDSIGAYNRINVSNSEYLNPEFLQVYTLAKLGAYLGDNIITYDQNNYPQTNLEDKLVWTGNSNISGSISSDFQFMGQERIRTIKEDSTLSDTEKDTQIKEFLDAELYKLIGNAVSNAGHQVPELREYLKKTYLMSMLPSELQENLAKIQQATGEFEVPYEGSNFKIEDLRNFSKMSDVAKRNYLQHPTLLKHVTLYEDNATGTMSPYSVLSNLTEAEWQIFSDRDMEKYIDLIAGYNVSHLSEEPNGANIIEAISMPDENWQKIQDFGLFDIRLDKSIGITKNSDLKFTFDDMQDIVEKMSHNDWVKAQERGLVDMKPSCGNGWGRSALLNNYGHHIGTDIISALSKVPNSTFNFLKTNLELIKNGEFQNKANFTEQEQESVAYGLEFLSKSHNDVYEHMTELKSSGIPAYTCIQLLGVGAEKYGKFDSYMTDKAFELRDKILETIHKESYGNTYNDNFYIQSDLPYFFPMYLDLQSIKDKSNINELSIEEKRALLKNLVKYNAGLFNVGYDLFDSPIIPKNKEEYCSILPKLIKSIGIDSREVTPETINNFETAMDKMAQPDSEFMGINFTKAFPILKLEYPRKDFITDVMQQISGLSDTEKMKVYDYFGFDLKEDKNGVMQMHGYPINVNNGAKMAEIQDDNTKSVVESVRPLVEKFSNDNKVTIDGKPELSAQINDILELFPEFRTTIGKVQHKTHDFSVDTHTLKVLQGVMSNPKYKLLPEKDKKLLNIATLLHDLTKAENLVDKTHPAYSAYDAYYILSKMNMPEEDKVRIYQIIKNHDWSERYNTPVKIGPHQYREKTPAEKLKVAKDIAFELKDGNNFEMATILAEADMKGVKETNEFFTRCESGYREGVAQIKPLVENIKSTAIHLPQTKLPKASGLVVDGENVKEIDINGQKIRVVMLKKDTDLGALGFEKGLKAEDFNVIVHALEQEDQSTTFQALSDIDADALLSSSYINYKKGNYHVFRPQGFILDVASSDIQAGTYRDFGSGYKKDLDGLKSDYLFNGKRKDIRNFMSDKVKSKLKLSNEEYKKLYEEMADKSVSELDETNPRLANAMREFFDEMEIHKRRFGRNYNEWLVSRPKIQGVFLDGGKYNEYNLSKIPEFLTKYAHDNDLPVIMFCDE